MNFLPPALAAVVLALASPSFFQDPGTDGPPPKKEEPRIVSIKELLGAWRLTEFETLSLKRDSRHEVGVLLIAEDFLSFECHIGWLTDSGARESATFFSGTHTYKLREDGVLELTSLIGTTIDPNGSSPVFEPVGRRREYKVKFNLTRLVLERDKNPQTFTFERIASPGLNGLDFYGRRKKPENDAK